MSAVEVPEVFVSKHAVAAYARRRRDSRDVRLLEDHDWVINDLWTSDHPHEVVSQTVRFYRTMEQEIRDCVAEALAEGKALRRKPQGFVLYKRRHKELPPGQKFVQCDDESNYGFIVKTIPEGEIVVTTITRAGVRK